MGAWATSCWHLPEGRSPPAIYRPRNPARHTSLSTPSKPNSRTSKRCGNSASRKRMVYWRGFVDTAWPATLIVERGSGFARLKCEACGAKKLLTLSCKQRGICPSCAAKRAAAFYRLYSRFGTHISCPSKQPRADDSRASPKPTIRLSRPSSSGLLPSFSAFLSRALANADAYWLNRPVPSSHSGRQKASRARVRASPIPPDWPETDDFSYPSTRRKRRAAGAHRRAVPPGQGLTANPGIRATALGLPDGGKWRGPVGPLPERSADQNVQRPPSRNTRGP